MKQFITVLFLIISSYGFSQRDTICMNEIKEIKLNLNKCHKQYQTGTSLVVGGILISTCMYAGNSNNLFSTPLKKGLFFASVGMAMIGYFIQIDSHKFIGRAGITNNGLTIEVQLK